MNIDIKKVKIEISAPSENIQEIRNAICEEGAGVIGNYSHCTISTKCKGTFKPLENANPYIGEIDKLELVDEEKLQAVCDIDILKKVLKRLREVHPYEEPAINIIPLIDEESL